MKKTAIVIVFALPVMVMANTFETKIEARKTAFSGIETGLESVDDLIDGRNTDWQEMINVSQTLVTHGNTLETAFPSGSKEGSKAKSDIWDKPEKFNSLLNKMVVSFDQLSLASQNEDSKMAKNALKQAESTCRNCHRSYRSRW
ncbi:MAG: cytochrome c [Moritella sp.]|uniref:c-type cytochrome n=1 Tax=Moritella sp. TaxID=78556 RepID=UPI00216E6FEE|nr:cytochrome c [Moritella sp.]MBL1415542.1 cytochrome c [Moritella sp.]